MKKEKLSILFCIFLALQLLLLSGCSSIGLLSEKNSWVPQEIESLGDFLGVYIVLQISVILVSLIIGIFLGEVGHIISIILHFIWIISYRDYGFFKVLLLFGLFSIISFIINSLRLFKKNKY
jgi:hypothetical protein